MAGGATFDLNSFNETAATLSGSGAVTLGTATLTLAGTNATTFAGLPSPAMCGLVQSGAGNLTLAGSNSYTGATAINAGTLQFGAVNAAPGTSAFTVAGGASLVLNGFNQSIGSLAGAGSVSLGTGTLTLGGNNASTTFTGVISGAGGLAESGTGTITLTGSSSMTGTVNLNSGGLLLTGSNGSLANVSSLLIGTGATLTVSNTSGSLVNRLSDSAVISLNGGTFAYISSTNGSSETVGTLNALGGASTVSIASGGTFSSLTFSSLGTIAAGASVNFAASGGTLGSGPSGPHIYILGESNGFMGGWATVGSNFAQYFADGVQAFSNYYTGSDGLNVNDSTKIVLLSGSSPSTAYTLTNAGTTTDSSLNIADAPVVSLGSSNSQALNLATGGLIKSTMTPTTISGQGMLTASGTTAGSLTVSVGASNTLTISTSIVNNAGPDGIYGNADDGVVALVNATAGTLIQTASNSFSGNVYLNAGILSVSAENNLGNPGNDVIFSGGALNITSGFTASAGKQFSRDLRPVRHHRFPGQPRPNSGLE